MPVAVATRSTLVVVDLQTRLMPAIAEASRVLAKTGILLAAARLIGVPVLYTEQNPRGLGSTVPELAPAAGERVVEKTTFDACGSGLLGEVPDDSELILCGCEAHVCVLQTALGAQSAGRSVKVVADAVGSRDPENRKLALERLGRHHVDVVSAEMILFEWLGSSEHFAFKDTIALIK